MLTDSSELSVADLAQLLRETQGIDHRIVLFLGSRAGALFRSKYFYETCKFYSARSFNALPQIKQFAECYRVLHQIDFSKDDLLKLLTDSLHALPLSEPDILLAELVKKGIFDIIISTNVDGMLEQAFSHTAMRALYDYQIFIPQHDSIDDIYHIALEPCCKLVKIFGDIALQKYTMIGRDMYLENNQRLKHYLGTVLSNDVLMVGYDPLWDRAIAGIFPEEGRRFWLVSEEKNSDDSMPLLQVMEKYKERYVIGGDGSYDQFIKALHWHIVKEELLSSQSATSYSLSSPGSPALPEVFSTEWNLEKVVIEPISEVKASPIVPRVESDKGPRSKVFIGYSQQDKKYLEQLKKHLAPYRNNPLDIWDDTKIVAGTKWREEMQKTLAATKTAILLISPDFLASSFIAENILPPLLHAAGEGGASIVPFLLKECVMEATPLQEFQVFNHSEPLTAKKGNDRNKAWADLVRFVVQQMKQDEK